MFIKSISFILSMLCIASVKAQEPRALIGHNRNLKPKSTKSLEAKSLEAKSLKAKSLKAKSLKAESLEAKTCTKSPPSDTLTPIYSTALREGYTIFASLLKEANLDDTLSSLTDGEYTVMAPNDDAFASVPSVFLDLLVKPANQNFLKIFLAYHITQQSFQLGGEANITEQFFEQFVGNDKLICRTEDYLEENECVAQTMAGSILISFESDCTVLINDKYNGNANQMINQMNRQDELPANLQEGCIGSDGLPTCDGARVVEPDLIASNGILHGIDAVLFFTGPLNFVPGGGSMLKEVSDSQERLVEIVSDLGGNLDGKFGIVEDLLSSQECACLREYADSELVEALKAAVQEEEHEIQEDFRFEVSPSKLASLIDVDSIRSMHKAFKDYDSDFPVTRVIIRRTSLTGNKHIQYHSDGDTSVMHVWLNEEDTVDGGNLVFLNKDGAHLVPTKPGSAALHKDKIVHGITPVNGTRYILIFVGDNRFESDVLESVVS